MATFNVTDETFEEQVIKSSVPVVIDFWAEWCGPCRAYGPVYEKISEEFPDVVFGKIDTEAQPELGRLFNIRSIPTTIAFKQEIGVFMQPGALPENALRDLIKTLIDLDMDEVREEMAKKKAENPDKK